MHKIESVDRAVSSEGFRTSIQIQLDSLGEEVLAEAGNEFRVVGRRSRGSAPHRVDFGIVFAAGIDSHALGHYHRYLLAILRDPAIGQLETEAGGMEMPLAL